jgi:GT2 family glycosyltransferase
MLISVIVPTYRRPQELAQCLSALGKQSRLGDEVIVTVRDTDIQTREFLASNPGVCPKLRVVTVTEPGVIAAMNAGLKSSQGQIIALTDDDAAPWPDWLLRIEAHFANDPAIGGVGGRDRVYHAGKLDEGQVLDVGRLSWFGRVSAGHHHAIGPARDVDVLKGVNCAYRAEPLKAIEFDSRLAGTGAQVYWELSLGLAFRRAGWRLVLDPAIGVDHFPATRFDEDQREGFNDLAHRNAVANETLILLEHLPPLRRVAFFEWAGLIGTRGSPGLLQTIRLLLKREAHVLRRRRATAQGRLAGLMMYRETRRQGTARRNPPPPPPKTASVPSLPLAAKQSESATSP